MSNAVTNVVELEAVIGTIPAPSRLKVIDHLDEWALRWIAAAPLMLACFADEAGPHVTPGGGPIGFATGDPHELRLPTAVLDDASKARPGVAFASLFLLPGIGETLRINGKVVAADANEIRVAVEECYGHCAKSLLRSELWSARPVGDVPAEPESFIAASRLMVLATVSADGRADISPKGDPAGRMAKLDGDVLWFADRPGNRRVDSFRNIITQPRIAVVLVIPGASRIAIVTGDAALTTDEAARQPFTVEGKTPPLAIRVQTHTIGLHESPALDRAHPWPAVLGEHGINPTKLAISHIKLNRNKGFSAKLTSAILGGLDATGLVQKVVDKEYKDKLY